MEVQNTDGGLGLSGDYTSDILDSVLALESINASSSAEVSSARWQLLCYIARQMNSDGSFSYTKNSDSDVALSAMALYTVSKYLNDNNLQSGITSNMRDKTGDYISNNFDDSFPEETIEDDLYSALALDESGLLDEPEEVVSTLYDIQQDDGSFYDDVHLTALVIWLLGEMDTDHLVQIYDLKTSNTPNAYYGVDTNINVAYALSYKAKMDAEYTIRCTITNGDETIYKSDDVNIILAKGEDVKQGTFDGISIKEDKDDGITVKIELLEDGTVVKESMGTVSMENQPRAGETSIDDYYISLDKYYTFKDSPVDITASLDLLYSTNVPNTVDIQTILSKDGVILSDETVTDSLMPEEEILKEEVLQFTPDVTEASEYRITVKCIYEGEIVTEETVSFYVLDIPNTSEESNDDDLSDSDDDNNESEIIPFTVSWIGPKLSDYVIYSGSETEITVSAGILYYSSDDFQGTVKTVVLDSSDEEVESSELSVSLEKDSYSRDIEDILSFMPEEVGDYKIITSLYNNEGDEIKSGQSVLKVLEKKRIDFIANSKLSEEEKQTVDFNWNDISNSQDIYNYKLYRRYDGTDWETRSIWNEKDKVKVLNVYPVQPLLEEWMTTTVDMSENPAGMGMFDIDSVYIDDYNTDPERYMLDGNKWKYDVVYFGSWNCNNYKDLSNEGYEVTQRFVDSGRGVLFGHDTVCQNFNHVNFCKFEDQLGILVKNDATAWSTTSVAVVNRGTLTTFPWTLRGTLTIPACHSFGQFIGGSLAGTEWMRLDADKRYDSDTGSHSNFYLMTNNNLGMIQTGHSNGQATDDERKVLANTLFYLHQISQVTTTKDNSFYDLAAPDAPTIDFAETSDDKVSFVISANDNGTKYQYYIEAISSTDDETTNEKSNIMTETAISGVKGYVYDINSSPDEDSSIIAYDEDDVVNVTSADNNGHLIIAVNSLDIEEGKYLHIFTVDNENNVSRETIFQLDEGILSTNITTDKDRYQTSETVLVESNTTALPLSAKGDVSLSLYDEEGNYIKELYYENKLTVKNSEPYEIDTDLRLDDSYDGEYTLKVEWTDKGDTICSASTVFVVNDDIQISDTDKTVKREEIKNTTKKYYKDNTNQSAKKEKSLENKQNDSEPDKGNAEKIGKRTNADSPGTGDGFSIIGFVMVKILSLTAIAIIVWRKKKNEKKYK